MSYIFINDGVLDRPFASQLNYIHVFPTSFTISSFSVVFHVRRGFFLSSVFYVMFILFCVVKVRWTFSFEGRVLAILNLGAPKAVKMEPIDIKKKTTNKQTKHTTICVKMKL